KTKKFYSWYLDNYYNKDKAFSPTYEIRNDTIYHLDTVKYLNLLRETKYFSSDFIKRESEKYGKCNKELMTISFAEIEECGCNPAEFAESCDFTFYDNWLFHQG